MLYRATCIVATVSSTPTIAAIATAQEKRSAFVSNRKPTSALARVRMPIIGRHGGMAVNRFAAAEPKER
jgi:hypothetical protein